MVALGKRPATIYNGLRVGSLLECKDLIAMTGPGAGREGIKVKEKLLIKAWRNEGWRLEKHF